jgi:hypothetical protein
MVPAMVGRKNFQEPDHRSSAGLPVSILLLSILGITAYLLVEGSLLDRKRDGSKVYLPVPQVQDR